MAQRKITKVDVGAFWPTGEGVILDDVADRTVRCVQRMSLLEGRTYSVVISFV
ncbi:MAG: hypothetical protein O7G87_12850 [bacterium]|nr:hypothetical protein [bacterium]